ncbi:MAG TPA: hypothetical protein PLZ43_15730 [bacterium]|nr:hypothetical protein [bacterium]
MDTKTKKAFKIALIKQNKTLKQWISEKNLDLDRIRNVFSGRVKATEEETRLITEYSGVKNGKMD